MGENARNNFSRNKPIERAKNVKKWSQKSAKKNFFLYSQEYCEQKIGGKKRARQFFQKLNEKCGQKMLGKKSPLKIAKKRF